MDINNIKKHLENLAQQGNKRYDPSSFDDRFVIEKEKKTITIHVKNGPLVDGWIPWRGGKINVPFKPWMIFGSFNIKEYTADELCADITNRWINWESLNT